jgi:signal transduction histidine kinase
MKIRAKLTLIFTMISATFLLAFVLVINYAASSNRENEFYELLRKEAITKANLFFNANIESQILQDIYRNNIKTLNEVEVAIYDSAFNLLYHDAFDIDIVKETPEMINSIYKKSLIKFYQNDWQVIGLLFPFQNKNYIITAAAYDQYGYNKLKNLQEITLIVFIISVLLIYFSGRFFSRKAFTPVKEITDKAREISSKNLHSRIEIKNTKDELAELASTFNEMLERLNKSFTEQNHFVSNIAHELRTPLSAMVTELELASLKERNIEEYKKIIKNIYSDSKKLIRLINALLDFARASYDPYIIKFKPVRIDEIILDAKLLLQKSNSDYKIDIHFENELDDENSVMVNGNEYFLKAAFVNLLENGCKYSEDKHTTVKIRLTQEYIELKFIDNGIGISEDDLPNIFEPFFRGKNKNYVDGSGIGLALTSRVIALHKGNISVTSSVNNGSVFTVTLPNLSSSQF